MFSVELQGFVGWLRVLGACHPASLACILLPDSLRAIAKSCGPGSLEVLRFLQILAGASYRYSDIPAVAEVKVDRSAC